MDAKQTIDEIKKKALEVIKSHNDLSYQQVSLILPTIPFDMHDKLTDPISKDIVAFFKDRTAHRVLSINLNAVINSIEYTTGDLSMHIDRSDATIADILSDLIVHRMKLTKLHEELEVAMKLWISQFVELIVQTATADSNTNEIVRVLFACMGQRHLRQQFSDKGVDLSHDFIPVGLVILSAFSASFTESDRLLIRVLNRDLKNSVLRTDDDVNNDESEKVINRLQTFGLAPDEEAPMSLSVAMKELFGVDIAETGVISLSTTSLTKALQLSTRDTGVPTGLFVISSPNPDAYFDMSELMAAKASHPSNGVNEHAIKTTNILREFKASANVSSMNLQSINVTAKVTQLAYIIWTNDNKTFKIRRNPIRQPIIDCIERREPSPTIELYNRALSKEIHNVRANDRIHFNQVKNMSFSSEITEESFLETLSKKLSIEVVRSLKKLNQSEALTMVSSAEFIKDVLDVIDMAKLELGIHPNHISSHVHLIYCSAGNTILRRIQKSLMNKIGSGDDLNEYEIEQIVSGSVRVNDNIFSRVLASHYLHRS